MPDKLFCILGQQNLAWVKTSSAQDIYKMTVYGLHYYTSTVRIYLLFMCVHEWNFCILL